VCHTAHVNTATRTIAIHTHKHTHKHKHTLCLSVSSCLSRHRKTECVFVIHRDQKDRVCVCDTYESFCDSYVSQTHTLSCCLSRYIPLGRHRKTECVFVSSLSFCVVLSHSVFLCRERQDDTERQSVGLCLCVCLCVCILVRVALSTRTIAVVPSENDTHVALHSAEYSLFYRALLQKRPVILLQKRLPCKNDTHVALHSCSRAEYSLFYRALLQKRPVILLQKRLSCMNDTYVCVTFLPNMNLVSQFVFGSISTVRVAYSAFLFYWALLQKRPVIVRDIRLNYRSLLQNIVSFIGLFCKRDL